MVESGWTQWNNWTTTLDFGLMQDTINKLVAQQFLSSVQTEVILMQNQNSITSLTID